MLERRKILALPALLAAVALAVPAEAQRPQLPKPHPDLPDDFRQLLPRGKVITSIDKPKFVKAKKADINDEAWVLGVVVEGQARAYSLNLLNSHEVVNDEIGGTKFAAVW